MKTLLFLGRVFSLLAMSPLSSDITLRLWGQLGNQLFQIAAAVALAEENNCKIHFPEFIYADTGSTTLVGIEDNYYALYQFLPYSISYAPVDSSYTYSGGAYLPIPYSPNMALEGYFQSERYFKKHKDLIRQLFGAPEHINEDLQEHFADLLENPRTVGIHVRTWFTDLKSQNFDPNFFYYFLAPDMEYYRKAIEIFDKESLFVVFSDGIEWCKEQFSQIDRKFLFIEGQHYLHDFYLLSKCKHIILGSSTFSWWAAYLNENPLKKVICRRPFMGNNGKDPEDIICDEWIAIDMPQSPPIPDYVYTRELSKGCKK